MPTTERAGLVTAENVADRLAAVLDDTFARAHARHQAERAAARDDPYELSPSTLGGCIRQAAYRLAGTPPTNPEPAVPRPGAVSRAALIGTWIHAGMLPVLAESLDAAGLGPATVETPVTTVFGGYTLTGHADLVTPELVIDLKTVREYKLGRIDRRSDSQRQDGRPDGPVVWPGARWQAGCYALGVHQARIRAGQMPPRWIAWPYLDRSTGEDRICVEPWTPAFGLEVIERFRTLAAHAADPDTAPRNRRGPGLDLDCDACPWRDRAWPVPPPQPATPEQPDGNPGELDPGERFAAQAALATDAATVERFGRAYLEHRDAAARHRWLQELAAAVIRGGGRAPGRYGAIEYGLEPQGTRLDVKATRELLNRHHLPIPEHPGGQRIKVQIAKPVSRKTG